MQQYCHTQNLRLANAVQLASRLQMALAVLFKTEAKDSGSKRMKQQETGLPLVLQQFVLHALLAENPCHRQRYSQVLRQRYSQVLVATWQQLHQDCHTFLSLSHVLCRQYCCCF